MRDFPTIYRKNGKNVWEEYFEQPLGYTLDDIYKAQHVTFSYDLPRVRGKKLWSVAGMEGNDRFENLKKDLFTVHPFFKRNDGLYRRRSQTNFGRSERCYLMYRRGTAYNNTLIGIDKQPTADTVISKVKDFMHEVDFHYVYCATEDKRIYEKFKNEF